MKNDSVTYSVLEIPIDRIRAFAEQPRKWFNPEDIRARAESMRVMGQQDPVTVERIEGDPDHDYELINGESRLRSAKAAGITVLWAAVRSVPFNSVTDKHMASLVANFNRSDHMPMEISDALALQIKSGSRTQLELAKALGKTDFWVSAYLSLQKLHPEIKSLLHPSTPKHRRIPLTVAFELARAPLDQQAWILAEARGADGAVTKLRVEIEMMRRNLHTKKKRRMTPSKRQEKLNNALRTLRLDLEKLKQVAKEDSSEFAKALSKDRALREELHEAIGETWTAQKEVAYQEFHRVDENYSERLRKGIEEFRQMLWARYGSVV